MENRDYEKELLYLNRKRLEIANSEEFFWGKKLIKYRKYLLSFKFLDLIKDFRHDIYAFFNKNVSNHKIINFSDNAMNSFRKKVVVYTCIYGNYDKILEPLSIDKNCDYYIFTDQEIPSNSTWMRIDDSLIPKECDTPAKKNRYVKMFPYKFFDCDYSIYIDGNLQSIGYPSLLVQKNIKSSETGIEMHLAPRENCIYEEAKTVYHVGKINKNEMHKVLAMYKKNKMPKHYGMFECNVIVRDHNNPNCKKIMENWWTLYSKGVKRDQLYFTYVLFKLGYKFSDVVNFGASVNHNILFLRTNHS